jgi:hypothetical protein
MRVVKTIEIDEAQDVEMADLSVLVAVVLRRQTTPVQVHQWSLETMAGVVLYDGKTIWWEGRTDLHVETIEQHRQGKCQKLLHVTLKVGSYAVEAITAHHHPWLQDLTVVAEGTIETSWVPVWWARTEIGGAMGVVVLRLEVEATSACHPREAEGMIEGENMNEMAGPEEQRVRESEAVEDSWKSRIGSELGGDLMCGHAFFFFFSALFLPVLLVLLGHLSEGKRRRIWAAFRIGTWRFGTTWWSISHGIPEGCLNKRMWIGKHPTSPCGLELSEQPWDGRLVGAEEGQEEIIIVGAERESGRVHRLASPDWACEQRCAIMWNNERVLMPSDQDLHLPFWIVSRAPTP